MHQTAPQTLWPTGGATGGATGGTTAPVFIPLASASIPPTMVHGGAHGVGRGPPPPTTGCAARAHPRAPVGTRGGGRQRTPRFRPMATGAPRRARPPAPAGSLAVDLPIGGRHRPPRRWPQPSPPRWPRRGVPAPPPAARYLRRGRAWSPAAPRTRP